ncbi:hypothetical protein LGV61_10100 [Desulfurispirillum indicum]|uniref:Uncharacterized protein n=1 Tax=Desulfurispirillum indicum (strain ATCC BAA-1389 / DSM 22839 / S5) TaxID=653733 RepID=E6W2K1_DESIS|nr:hypothetical protein [Desulfurispirillum indicum]ADU66751.1 hypothetical protein Selin_2031 [Desulfurispirillum indicum S5]UCZ56073.1 hypothetical protein LGV61_10100 [Desulfurispirillum indicum]
MNRPFNPAAVFWAGVISHGLLGIARHDPTRDKSLPEHALLHGLQGGIALGSGALAYNCFASREPMAGVAVVLTGASLMGLLRSPSASNAKSPPKSISSGEHHVRP